MRKYFLVLIILSTALLCTGCQKNTSFDETSTLGSDSQIIDGMETKVLYDNTFYQSHTTPGGIKLWTSDPEEKWDDYIIDAIDASDITNEMSDYEKCIAINDYICSVVSYVSSKDVNLTQYEHGKSITTNYCLVLGEGNCEGYADAFQSLCIACGIECYQSVGFMYDQNHCWNKVVIDGTKYWVDATWNDEYDNAYLMSPTLWENHEIIF